MTSCTAEDWKAIVGKAIEQARRGDATARKWLADYLVGEPEKNLIVDTIISWEDGED